MHTEWNRAASGAESTACELCQIHVCMCTHMRVSHSFVRAFVCGFLCSRRPMGQRPFILQSECAHACRPNRTYVISPQCARVSHAMYTNNTLIRRCRTCANVCVRGRKGERVHLMLGSRSINDPSGRQRATWVRATLLHANRR